MATLSSVGRGLDLASQLAIDVRDVRAIQERARAAEEARGVADQRAGRRTIEDEIKLLDGRRRAAMQEQLDAERARAADAAELATSASYTRPPGLALRYQATNAAATQDEPAALASTAAGTPAFESPLVPGVQLGDWAATAAYQLQVAAGTDAASSRVRVRA